MKKTIIVLIMVLLFPIISLAGWEHDGTGTRYNNDDGTYKTGWYQDVDGKWYYLDDNTGYILKNTYTPDGYAVDDTGAYVRDLGLDIKQYENEAKFEVTAYETYGSQTLKQFGYSMPVTVYYNSVYNYPYKAKNLTIEIVKLDISKDGVLYSTYNMSEETYYHQLKVITKYTYEDGAEKKFESEIGSFCWNDKHSDSSPVMDYYGRKNDPRPISAEVYIDIADVE